jgi:predicted dehydrogenase
MESVRLGIVGAGSVAKRHLRASLAVPRADIVGLTDVVPERADALARSYGVDSYAGSDELYAVGRPEAVIVAVPTARHAGVVIAAAQAGLHVLCEKPMATSLVDCDAMIAACRRAGVTLGGCQVMQRHHARLAEGKRVVEDGALGELIAMHVRRRGDYRRTQREAWQHDPVQAGGGVVLNLATYAIDEFQWLAQAPVQRVTACIPWRDDAHGIETEAMAVLEMANGVVATLVELDADLPGSEEMELVFTRGSLSLSAHGGLRRYRDGVGTQLVEPIEPRTADGERAMIAQMADFVDTIIEGRKPEVDGPWQRSIVAAALALYESARTGEPVRVDAGHAG